MKCASRKGNTTTPVTEVTVHTRRPDPADTLQHQNLQFDDFHLPAPAFRNQTTALPLLQSLQRQMLWPISATPPRAVLEASKTRWQEVLSLPRGGMLRGAQNCGKPKSKS